MSPVHALRDEVQPDVKGQPDRADPGGGSAEHLISWRERGLTSSCCHKGDVNSRYLHNTEETHSFCLYLDPHYSVFRLLCSDTVHVPPPHPPVSVPEEVKLPGAAALQLDHCYVSALQTAPLALLIQENRVLTRRPPPHDPARSHRNLSDAIFLCSTTY